MSQVGSSLEPQGRRPTEPQAPRRREEDVVITEPGTTELKETLYVKLPNTFLGNRKDLEVFLL